MQETTVFVVRMFDRQQYKSRHLGVCDSIEIAREFATKGAEAQYPGINWQTDWIDDTHIGDEWYRDFCTANGHEAYSLIIQPNNLINRFILDHPIA